MFSATFSIVGTCVEQRAVGLLRLGPCPSSTEESTVQKERRLTVQGGPAPTDQELSDIRRAERVRGSEQWWVWASTD